MPLVVLTTLFFMWGGLTSLNDVLIPHLKGIFSLSYFEAMLVQFCFFGAYGLMSIPAGRLVQAIGFKSGIMVGLAGAALGCLLFYPAAAVRSYGVFLFAFFVLATGIVILQVAANPFVAVLGKPETASSPADADAGVQLARDLGVSTLHRPAHSGGGGPFGGGAGEADAGGGRAQRARRRRPSSSPTSALALALALLAVIVSRSKLPSIDTTESADGGRGERAARSRQRLAVPPPCRSGRWRSSSTSAPRWRSARCSSATSREPYTLGLRSRRGDEAHEHLLAVRDDRTVHRQPVHAAAVQAGQAC